MIFDTEQQHKVRMQGREIVKLNSFYEGAEPNDITSEIDKIREQRTALHKMGMWASDQTWKLQDREIDLLRRLKEESENGQ